MRFVPFLSRERKHLCVADICCDLACMHKQEIHNEFGSRWKPLALDWSACGLQGRAPSGALSGAEGYDVHGADGSALRSAFRSALHSSRRSSAESRCASVRASALFASVTWS